MKFKHYNGIWANSYFWRTHDQQEIDYLEERDGMLHAFEIKWNPKEKAKLPIAFSKTYPNHSFQIVNRDNIQEFI